MEKYYIRCEKNEIIEIFNPIILEGMTYDDPRTLYHPDYGWIETESDVIPQLYDVFFAGVLYQRPENAVEFDFDNKKWVVSLEAIKAEKIQVIDTRTQGLIRSGFSFDDNLFSMSDSAQRNWIALSSGMANKLLSFPMTISTIDDSSYVIKSADDLKAFLGAYLIYQSDPNQPLGAGRILKERVTAAETVEEVESIVDDRE